MTARMVMKLLVTEVTDESDCVKVITVRHPLRPTLPLPEAGAHVDLRLPDGKVRQYSLCGDPADCSRYRFAVKREQSGRGGSAWIHETVRVGSTLHVCAPRNNFGLASNASRHVFIAGGIGITPFLAMVAAARTRHENFHLHFFARSRDQAPMLGSLQSLCDVGELSLHFSDAIPPPQRFSPHLLGDPCSGVHVYCCGPARLVDAVREATADWPEEQVHFEVFKPVLDEHFKPEPFDIRIASTGRVLRVPADRSALDVLRDSGLLVSSSCELGVCGSCECGYSDGAVIHRDSVLSVGKRQDRMMPCVSRARGSVTLAL